jgi:hypothetical protein
MSSYDFLGLPLLENAVAAMTAARAATPYVFSGSAREFHGDLQQSGVPRADRWAELPILY